MPGPLRPIEERFRGLGSALNGTELPEWTRFVLERDIQTALHAVPASSSFTMDVLKEAQKLWGNSIYTISRPTNRSDEFRQFLILAEHAPEGRRINLLRNGFLLIFDQPSNTITISIPTSLNFAHAINRYRHFMRIYRSHLVEHPDFMPQLTFKLRGKPHPSDGTDPRVASNFSSILLFKIVTDRPGDVKALVKLGNAYLGEGHNTSALFTAQYAYAISPDAPEVLSLLSNVLVNEVARIVRASSSSANMEEASVFLEAAKRALEEANLVVTEWHSIDPDNTELIKRNNELEKITEFTGIRFLEAAIFFWGKGRLPRKDDLLHITEILEKAYAIYPTPEIGRKLAKLYTIIGTNYLKDGQVKRAEGILYKAVQLEPDNIVLGTIYTKTLRKTYRSKEALELLLGLLERNNTAISDHYFLLELARNYVALENPEQARKVYQHLIELPFPPGPVEKITFLKREAAGELVRLE